MSSEIMHAPLPGPDYWDWRCLICEQPVASHALWWRRVWHRITVQQVQAQEEK